MYEGAVELRVLTRCCKSGKTGSNLINAKKRSAASLQGRKPRFFGQFMSELKPCPRRQARLGEQAPTPESHFEIASRNAGFSG